jgi:hypothetical protein
MEYEVLAQKISNPFVRNVPKAIEDLSKRVNERIREGWEPQGGVAAGAVGTAPYLFQALVKRR